LYKIAIFIQLVTAKEKNLAHNLGLIFRVSYLSKTYPRSFKTDANHRKIPGRTSQWPGLNKKRWLFVVEGSVEDPHPVGAETLRDPDRINHFGSGSGQIRIRNNFFFPLFLE
jgi:hypothetical protein